MPITPETLKLSEALRNRINRIVDGLTGTMAVGWANAWDDLERRLANALSGLLADGIWPSRRTLGRSKAVQNFLSAAGRSIDSLLQMARLKGVAAVRDAAGVAVGHQQRLIASQYPPRQWPEITSPAEGDLTAISRRADQRIVALTRTITADTLTDLVQALVRGTPASSDPDTTIRRVTEQLQRQYNGSLNRALVIVRTEVMDAHRAAAKAAQDAMADVLSGWIWLCRCDSAACGSCWALHGTVFPLEEAGPLDHPQGRCQRAPKAKTWADLGFDRDEPPDESLDPEAIFWALPEAVQLQIMGPVRLRLLKAGDIEWADLATLRKNVNWRDSYGPTPLRSLTRG